MYPPAEFLADLPVDVYVPRQLLVVICHRQEDYRYILILLTTPQM